MKKFRLLALLLALTMVLCALASCAKDPEDTETGTDDTGATEAPTTYADILNTDYQTADEVIAAMTAVTELNGYELYEVNYEYMYNENVAVFSKIDNSDPSNPITNYKLFSFLAGKVVLTLTKNNSVSYTLSLDDATSTLKATKVATTYTNSIPTGSKTTYHLYDASGAEIVNQSTPITSLSTLHDWVICDNVVYTVNEDTGALTKKGMLPINLSTSASYKYKTDSHLYATIDNTYIKVMDYDFNTVAMWSKPVSAMDSFNYFVLNDGNIIIQYVKQLEKDATNYDFYEFSIIGDTLKFDLVTEIFSITEKTSKTIDFNYKLDNSFSYKAVAKTEKYAEKFENIATVYPIIDKRVSSNDAEMDFVLLGNDGSIGKSIKLTEYQNGLPTKIAPDVYRVSTLYGYALVDVTGKVISQLTAYPEMVGVYWINAYGIYDTSFNLVYDFKEKNAVPVRNIGDAIFVKQYASADNHNDYTILSFYNGTTTEISKYNSADANHVTFDYIYGLDLCYLHNSENNEYKYYNTSGTLLTTTTFELEYGIGNLLYGYSNGEVVYYCAK